MNQEQLLALSAAILCGTKLPRVMGRAMQSLAEAVDSDKADTSKVKESLTTQVLALEEMLDKLKAARDVM